MSPRTTFSFRPQLEALDGRIVPSGSGWRPPFVPPPAQGNPPAFTPAPAVGTVDFAPLQTAGNYTLELKVTGSGGQTNTVTINNVTPQNAASNAAAVLTQAGWKVTVNGTSINIHSYKDLANPGREKYEKALINKSTGLKDSEKPRIGETKVGQGPATWQLHFASNDNTATLLDDVTANVTVNGVNYSTALTVGMTADDIAEAIADTLNVGGLGVTAAGGVISFTSSTVTDLGLSFETFGSQPAMNWLDYGVSIDYPDPVPNPDPV